MPVKRIIPCLDICDGKVVKGIRFVDLKEIGDPVASAAEYVRQGADEIVFLDITATPGGHNKLADLVRRTARSISIPLTVGGGIRTMEDIRDLLNAGADKISINSAAVAESELIARAAGQFGSRCIVLAVDAKKDKAGKYRVYIDGGRRDSGRDLLEWVREGERLGAGEILLTSIDADGTKAGFDIDMLRLVSENVGIPVIASGGCGTVDHFVRLFEETATDAALAASVFHYGELSVRQVKETLQEHGIAVSLL
ncbi:MAG TPA: imidazole glycerol phosphate synthase subunit HisF [Clostridiales bacterium]|jgi:cyclase|nr:imidazole glycerol phosphate synthase subunit HisF [Clostridiales bacterium]